MEEYGFIQVQTTFPDEDSAISFSKEIMVRKLAACVQMMPVKSMYFWKGEVQNDEELLLLIKTSTVKKQELEELVNELHPYDLPEFWVSRPMDGSNDYLQWITDSISP